MLGVVTSNNTLEREKSVSVLGLVKSQNRNSGHDTVETKKNYEGPPALHRRSRKNGLGSPQKENCRA